MVLAGMSWVQLNRVAKSLIIFRDPSPGRNLRKWMTDAGFQNIKESRFKLPIGPWAKDKHLVRRPLSNQRISFSKA